MIFFTPVSPGKMIRSHQEMGQCLTLLFFLFLSNGGLKFKKEKSVNFLSLWMLSGRIFSARLWRFQRLRGCQSGKLLLLSRCIFSRLLDGEIHRCFPPLRR